MANLTLPNFFIIGAAKAGTTALYHYLHEHPDVFMSPIKETNYFAYEGEGKQYHYLGPRSRPQFPVTDPAEYQDLFANAGDAAAVGEASPLYLESPVAAARIQAEIPDARIVVSLRNPADRAFSGYLMHVRASRAKWDLENAFPTEAHYVQVGFYHARLQRYFDRFPAERIKVLLFEDLRRDSAAVMRELYSFLGVDPSFTPAVAARHNVGGYPRRRFLHGLLSNTGLRNKLEPMTPSWLIRRLEQLRRRNYQAPPPFPAAVRSRLLETYREDIVRLQELIGRDLSGWLTD
ncbi:MAG: sulfotransferase [bacterium]